MLTPDEVIDTVRDLWKRHEDERAEHDRVYDYMRGKRGIPAVPEGSGDELEELARMSVKNVLGTVVDAFAQSLMVHGFRSTDAPENDAEAWRWWQSQRLDARQSEAHRPAVGYGTAYAVVTKSQGARLRTPRQMFAVYEDPSLDLWPIYALETWVDRSGPKPIRRGVLFDSTHEYPVDLGRLGPKVRGEEDRTRRIQVTIPREDNRQPAEHGAATCPVVRFVNARDAEDLVVGEVSPLIPQQRALNAVNFDRLTVSRFGAFPQKYAIGWATDRETLLKTSVARLMAFEDDDVKVGDFTQASVDGYNSIIEEMVAHVATTAQVPLSSFGSLINLSAEALAMAEAPYQRKLADKRESFGESWEQVLRLAGEIFGFEVSEDAEVVWRETEVRSYAQVVDGIVKLQGAGVPIEELLPDIPGWSQQRVTSARNAVRRNVGRGVLQDLRERAGTPPTPADVTAPDGDAGE